MYKILKCWRQQIHMLQCKRAFQKRFSDNDQADIVMDATFRIHTRNINPRLFLMREYQGQHS